MNSAAFDAANRDSFNTALSPELAQWVRPLAPYARLEPDEPFRPPCSLTCRRLAITNGQEYLFYGRHPVWGALEAVAVEGGARAAAGLSYVAIRIDTNEVAQTGAADAQGYVVVTPVPANAEREYRLEQGDRPPPT
jgi:hypothetical protein